MSEKAILSVAELASFLGVSKTIAYRLTASEGFPVLRLGKRILIPMDGLTEWIAIKSGSNKSRT